MLQAEGTGMSGKTPRNYVMEDGSKIQLASWVDLICPFCGGDITNAITTGDEPVSIHSNPPCSMYSRLDALEFVKAVNARLDTMEKGHA